jgi:SRSO17 transposase
MDEEQLRQLRPELEMFLERYLPHFGRSENHEHARRMVHGLLGAGDRRNVENIAEEVEGAVVRTMQKFVSQGVWQARDVLDEMQRHVVQALGEKDATINVDETGFPKKGNKSVGVKRQYSGTLGRIDNCQVGVLANYCSRQGHTLLDRRLYLPEEWAGDEDRRHQAGVPEGVVFRSKPDLALEMVQQAARNGMPFQWVGGDSVYGDSPDFVRGLRALRKWYVLDTSSDARVWLSEPKMRPLTKPRTGRPRKHPQPLTKPIPVAQAVAQLPESAFGRITVSQGSQGPIVYEYAELTVWFSEEGLPAPSPERLLVRRSLGQQPELKYHRCNAPRQVPLSQVAQQRALRWTIEQDIQAGKGESGLDEYETRGWVGWHHHTALSLLALFFLVLQRQRLGKKRAADERTGGSSRAAPSAGPASLGRGGDHRMEPAATASQPRRQRVSHKTPSSRIAASK